MNISADFTWSDRLTDKVAVKMTSGMVRFYDAPPVVALDYAQPALDYVMKHKDVAAPLRAPPIRFMDSSRLNYILNLRQSGIIDGVYMNDSKEIWLNSEQTDPVWRQGVLVHELVHYAQYAQRGDDFQIDGQTYLNDEYEAFAIQRAFLLDNGFHDNWIISKPWEDVKEHIRNIYTPFLARYGLTASDQQPA
jgi:hypothetical protein